MGLTLCSFRNFSKIVPMAISVVADTATRTAKTPVEYGLRNQKRDAKQKSGIFSTAATMIVITVKTPITPRQTLTFHLARGANWDRTPRNAVSTPKTS